MTSVAFHEVGPEDARWSSALSYGRHDIYHLPGYAALEARRVGARPAAGLVLSGGGALLVPYLVRPLEGPAGGTDVASPYGYSGALFLGAWDRDARREAVRCLLDGLRDAGHCSLFLRLHPILDDVADAFPEGLIHQTGETVVVDLTRPLDELYAKVRKSERYVARRLTREGYQIDFLPADGALDAYDEIYRETMERVGAAADYFTFDLAYDRALAALLDDRLEVAVVSLGGKPLSAKLYSSSGGVVQNLLGGTRTDALRAQPSVLEAVAAIAHYRERGERVLHLGGGLAGQRDSLFRFKAGFSGTFKMFSTARVILDERRYDLSVRRRAGELGVDPAALLSVGYFPAYRAAPP